MIIYKKGDLFSNAYSDSILAHACNAKGVWGSGIAKTFKELYPDEFKIYREHCLEHLKDNIPLVGTCLRIDNILCLFTSHGYAETLDSEEDILRHTQECFEGVMTLCEQKNVIIEMPKINSGRFGVAWEKTEEVINKVLTNHKKDVTIIVWEF
jgi:ADP-ribose 1''-phosphate phosphatase